MINNHHESSIYHHIYPHELSFSIGEDWHRHVARDHLGFMFVDGELLMPGLHRTMPTAMPKRSGPTMPRSAPEALRTSGDDAIMMV